MESRIFFSSFAFLSSRVLLSFPYFSAIKIIMSFKIATVFLFAWVHH